jgi:hypothetical protein
MAFIQVPLDGAGKKVETVTPVADHRQVMVIGDGTTGTLAAVGANGSEVDVKASVLPVGAATAANQLPDGHNVTVDNAAGAAAVNIQDGGNSITIDAASLPLPTGAATEATLASILSGQLPAGHDVTIDNLGGAAAVNIQDGGNSITVDAASLPLPTGAATEATLASILAGQLADGHNVTIDNAAGAAAVNIQDGGNSITIDATALPLPAGAATAANQLPDGHNVTVDNGAGAAAVNIQDGGNSVTIDATSLPLPTGAATEATLASILAGQLADGHNVTVDNVAGSPVPVQVGDGTNQVNITANSEFDVRIAEGQVKTASGTIAADLANVEILPVGFGGVIVQVTGVFVGLVLFEVSVDGTNYVNVSARQWIAGSQTSGYLNGVIGQGPSNVNSVSIIPAFGAQKVRCIGNSWTSGTATVTMRSIPGPAIDPGVRVTGLLGESLGVGPTQPLIVRLADGTVNYVGAKSQGDDSTLADVNPVGMLYDTTPPAVTDGQVGIPRMNASRIPMASCEGDIAHDAADSTGGGPVKIGHQAAIYGAAPPTVDTDEDRVNSIATPEGIQFAIGGHPNIITREYRVTDAGGSVSGQPIVDSVGATQRVVVTMLDVTAHGANTVNVDVRIGFGTASVPAEPAHNASVAGVLLSHSGLVAGGGVIKGDGSGIIGVGALNEEVRIDCDDPVGGEVKVVITYYIATL